MIYADIAMHGTLAVDHENFRTLQVMFMTLILSMIGSLWVMHRIVKRQQRGGSVGLTRWERLARRLSTGALVSWIVGAECVALLVVAVLWVVREDESMFVAHAERQATQCITILAPHESASHVLEWRAKLASVGSRSDYIALMQSLTSAADSAHVKLPHFRLW